MAVDQAEVARLEAELAEVRAAISAVRLYGAAHSRGGASLSRADLGALKEDERDIMTRLARARRGGGVPVWQAVPRG